MTLISRSNSGLLCRENLQFPHVGFLQSALDWKTTGSQFQTVELVKCIDNSIDFGGFHYILWQILWAVSTSLFLTSWMKRSSSQKGSVHTCVSASLWSFPCCHYWRNVTAFSVTAWSEGILLSKQLFFSVNPRLQKALIVCLYKMWGLCSCDINNQGRLSRLF